MSSDPDWWARGAGGLGTALGGLSLYLTRVDGRWNRRHSAMDQLADSLRELANPVQNRSDPQIVQQLFTVSAGSALAHLDGAVDKVPDWQFRKWLRRFVDALQAVRGAATPQPVHGAQQTLSAGQRQKLQEAEALLAKIQAKVTKAARKGSG